MAEELKDKLALRIQKRREEEAAKAAASAVQPAPVPVAVVPVVEVVETVTPAVAVQKFPTETFGAPLPAAPVAVAKPASTAVSNPVLDAKIAETREAIQSGKNPMAIARLMGELVGLGQRNKDLTGALGMSKSAVTKKLALLSAPVKAQKLIESGELPESDYYNNKNIKAQIKTKAGKLEYKRMPTVSISLETALALTSILRIIAEENGDTSLMLPDSPSRKDISALLDLRAGHILRLIQ